MNPLPPARWLPLLLAALALPASPASAAGDEPQETLGPGDGVRISVYQNPDLATETRVSESGLVSMPLVGEVPVAGLTPIDAGDRIARYLEDGRYLPDPQVTLTLMTVRSRQVAVLGHVARPGQYPLDGGGRRLIDILAMAGGIAESGDSTVIVLLDRDGGIERRQIDVPDMYGSGDLSANVELRGGDSIFVPGAREFYVYGEVRQAGSYRLRPNTTVLDAISLGGGLSPRGTDNGVRIHRQMPDGTVRVFKAKLADAVKANDVVHVAESLF